MFSSKYSGFNWQQLHIAYFLESQSGLSIQILIIEYESVQKLYFFLGPFNKEQQNYLTSTLHDIYLTISTLLPINNVLRKIFA